jgi:acetyl esterase/lipase
MSPSRVLRLWMMLLALCAPAAAMAQPSQSSTAAIPVIVRDVVYGHKAGMALTYDVFRPARPNGATIINVISGGWKSQWTAPESRVDGYRDLLDLGFTVVAFYHGSQPQFPIAEAAADLKRGVRFFRLHAKDYGVDPERIGVWGASAGGQLALVAALIGDAGDSNASDPVLRAPLKVRTAVAYYPPSDVDLLVSPFLTPALRELPEYAPDLLRAISPVFHVDPGDAPVLVIHGDADTQVDIAQSRRLHEVLDAAKVENRFIVMPGAGHSFRGTQATEARTAMIDWFTARLLTP